MTFSNPVGLAAGFDKNAEAVEGLAALGFGFIEVGTVTPRPQEGNPQPRVFRRVDERALINRLGFNNLGVRHVKQNLRRLHHRREILIGINIGKNKTTPLEKAAEDYRLCLQELYLYGDYFVVNISSPNTPGLRTLQQPQWLEGLLQALTAENKRLSKQYHFLPRPLLVKLSPDLTHAELEKITDLLLAYSLDGVVVSNTLLSPEGGVSGKPLGPRSTAMIAYIFQKTRGQLPLIGVGGILDPEDAVEKIQAGASLVQIYTGLIYEGPSLVRRIRKALIINQKSLFSTVSIV